jgi:type II secretory pathway pseudopilin PulG
MLKNKGQLLIEILVALAVVTVALVVSMAAVSSATKVSRVARQRLEATKYAEKVLEVLRRERDRDPETFFDKAVCGLCGPFGTNLEFACQLSCSFTTTDVQATVEILWESSQVSLSTVLSKYKL